MISATLRRAAKRSGLSVNAVAKLARIPQPNLHRFMVGESMLSLGAADRLASALGLRLVSKSKG